MPPKYKNGKPMLATPQEILAKVAARTTYEPSIGSVQAAASRPYRMRKTLQAHAVAAMDIPENETTTPVDPDDPLDANAKADNEESQAVIHRASVGKKRSNQQSKGKLQQIPAISRQEKKNNHAQRHLDQIAATDQGEVHKQHVPPSMTWADQKAQVIDANNKRATEITSRKNVF
ncbi:hypothetical protein EW145_g7741 [Phellinidium pouzarii]|uniref:Uncharacterized protein n=1 Tax=Phellinidium pouzarii TaxID=167371 RepID=A0A4S4KGK4_9AGAM|nr:hypothetical protein EW145_g7741 [Phellinidium pouzarii]